MSYKTQCPRCHTIYPMPESKLGDEKARANCGQCQHTFFLNAHLIYEEPLESKDSSLASRTPARPTQTKAKSDGRVKKQSGADELSVNDIDEFINQQINTQIPPTSPTPQPSKNKEGWVDELIKPETTTKPSSVSNRPNDDLSELIGADLDTLIPEVKPQESSDNIRKKIDERIKSHAPTQEQLAKQRSWLGAVLWGLGCVLMIGLAVGQYVLFNADSLAKTDKAPLINSLCQNCLPSADISVIKSGYTLRKGQADFSTELIGVLKNTSSTDQLYPNIKITIMGINGMIVGDLALAPKDYLASPARVISASSDGRFMLTLDLAPEEIHSVSIEPFY